MKNKRGITLIALIITIIIILILAGVSINAVIGENGVLTQAKNAVDKNNKAIYQEIIDIETASAGMEMLDDPEEYLEAVKEGIKVHPEFAGATFTKSNEQLMITTKDGHTFRIRAEDGNVKYLGTEDEIKAGLPEDLTASDIQINVSDVSSWKKQKTVTMSSPGYSDYDIFYTYDGTNWNTYIKPITIITNTSITATISKSGSVISGAPTNTATITMIDSRKPSITGPTVQTGSITTSGFTVNVTASDTSSGGSDQASGLSKIVWYVKDSRDSVYTNNEEETISLESGTNHGPTSITKSKTFSGLSYSSGLKNVKVEVYDVAGNVSTSETTVDLFVPPTLGDGHIDREHTGWTNSSVTVTLPTVTDFTTVYAYNASDLTSSPTTYNGPFNVSNNCTIYYMVKQRKLHKRL